MKIVGEQTDASQIPNEPQHTDNLATDTSMDEASKTIQNQDLSALESEILQLNNSLTENEPTKTQPRENTTLFLNGSDDCDDIGESQLMALCSGTFATQFLDNVRIIANLFRSMIMGRCILIRVVFIGKSLILSTLSVL